MSDKQSNKKKVPRFLHAVGISFAIAFFSTIYILDFSGISISNFIYFPIFFLPVFLFTFISTSIGAGVGLRRRSFRAMWIGAVVGGIISFFVAFYFIANSF